MNIEDFRVQYGGAARKIDDVLRNWQLAEIDDLLGAAGNQHADLIGSAVIVGDALHGDGMLDQISPKLRDAFRNLMHAKADSYAEMRRILRQAIRDGDGGYRPFDDAHVRGLISKLKGQIGENLFRRQVGSAAELAHSGSQEGWDIAVRQADGAYEYVQVKLYADPHGVVKHMLSVQAKVDNGWIEGCAGDTVGQIDFAVPADIFERVTELKEQYEQLESMRIWIIPTDAQAVADIVKEGMANVGPDQLEHFFDELFLGAVTAGSLHALVNGFLWYKGAKEFSSAIAETAANMTLTSVGMGIGLVAETLFQSALFSSAFGLSGRVLLGRVARSRWNFAEFLENSISATNCHVTALRQIPVVLPAAAS